MPDPPDRSGPTDTAWPVRRKHARAPTRSRVGVNAVADVALIRVIVTVVAIVARVIAVTSQAASTQVPRLTRAGLLVVERSGRLSLITHSPPAT